MFQENFLAWVSVAWLIVIMYTGDGKNILKLSLQVLLSGGGGGRGWREGLDAF